MIRIDKVDQELLPKLCIDKNVEFFLKQMNNSVFRKKMENIRKKLS